MRVSIFFIAIGIFILLYTYIGLRILVPLEMPQPLKSLIWSGIFIAAALPVITIVMRIYQIETVFNDVLSWFAYITFGFVSILFFFVVLKDLAVVGGLIFSRIHGLFQPDTAEAMTGSALGGSGDSRRQMLWTAANFAVLGLSGLLTGCGMVQARYQIKIEKVTVPLNNLSGSFEGLRIVQISDIHVGPTIKGGFVKAVVEKVNALEPDIIVLTGDLVDGSVSYLEKEVAALAELRSPGGKFFITGNHEYYSGVFPWLEKIKALGFDVLLNEHRVITRNSSNLILGGVTDISAGRMVPAHRTDPVASLKGAPQADARILLAHQPVSVYEASKAGYDLQLSGHTHGGQYFPYSKLIGMAQPFVAGLYRHEQTWLYVNRGTGYWGPPIRLGAPAEITEITLTGKKEST
ncbi:MAG: metallophosphoesterase [bacterium]